jgi:hypothetical protein
MKNISFYYHIVSYNVKFILLNTHIEFIIFNLNTHNVKKGLHFSIITSDEKGVFLIIFLFGFGLNLKFK